MSRIIRVLCSGAEQERVARGREVVQRYDGFLLLAITPDDAAALARDHLVEDLTELYTLRVGDLVIDTSVPRVDAAGAVHSHPAYRGTSVASGRHHYLVQFAGPIKSEWLAAVEGAGGELRAPFQGFAYVVRADRAALRGIAGLPAVRWVGQLPHAVRIASALRARLDPEQDARDLPRTRRLPSLYTVEFFDGDDLSAAVPALADLGFRVEARDDAGKILVVAADGTGRAVKGRLEALSAVHGVRSIRQRALKRTSNDVAPSVMGALVSKAPVAAKGLGLSGKGEVVGVCDTGLDSGNPAALHEDFVGRVRALRSYPITGDYAPYIRNPGGDDGPADLDSGHGTHVAGSVLGSGAASAGLPNQTPPIQGMAHRAELVFQSVEQRLDWRNPADTARHGRYGLAGIPLDLGALFADAYGDGARVHSNSWGGGDAGAYDSQCEQLDRFVWEHKDFCVVVAAGNDGTDNDGDGRVNAGSVTSPGTAKNCITVGACESRRPQFAADSYGSWWPDDFPAPPLRDDPMADDPDQVVAFSSRGPCAGGRTKPDVLAPGTFVLSTRSTQIAQNNQAWGAFPPSRKYFYMGGTSMATPLAAGAVALVREYLRKKRHIAAPSAALLKATLIAGATRLPGVGSAGAVIDDEQGFGRVDLDAVLKPAAPARARFFDVTPGLETGRFYVKSVRVPAGAKALKVVIAYSDYPGRSLVNDLNLIVRAPDGQVHFGNQGLGGPPAADHANNVEVVAVPTPAPGTWKIQVLAANAPHGPQEFALVVLG